MHITSLKNHKHGVGAVGVIVALVVIAIIVVAGVLVSKHNSNKTDTTKNNTSDTTSNTNKAATKSVSDVTFASAVSASGAPTVFTSDQLSSINQSQSANGGSQFFNAQGGYFIGESTEGSAVEWGATLKSTKDVDLKQYIESSAKQNASGDVSIKVTNAAGQEFIGSDGAKYKATCYTFTETVSGGNNYYGAACLGDVQKSSVYMLAQSTTSAATANANLSKLVDGSTLTLQ